MGECEWLERRRELLTIARVTKRAVSSDMDVFLLTVFHEFGLLKEGMSLDLIDDLPHNKSINGGYSHVTSEITYGYDSCGIDKTLDVWYVEIGDTDSLDLCAYNQYLERDGDIDSHGPTLDLGRAIIAFQVSTRETSSSSSISPSTFDLGTSSFPAVKAIGQWTTLSHPPKKKKQNLSKPLI